MCPVNLSLSATYELPSAKGVRGLQGKLLARCQVNAIAPLQTGFPLTPLIGTNLSGDGDTRTPDRPFLNPSFPSQLFWARRYSGSIQMRSFLQRPARGATWGAASTLVRGWRMCTFSIFKNVAISERTHLQFRAEFFNLPNRANLGPQTRPSSPAHRSVPRRD